MALRDTVRDSILGRIITLTIGPHVFPYPEDEQHFELELNLVRSLSAQAAPTRDIAPVPNELLRIITTKDEEARAARQRNASIDENTVGNQNENEKTKEEDKNLVSWYSDDDPANPHNWSFAKKTFSYGLICMLTFAIYGGSAIITPAEGILQEKFGLSDQARLLVLSMYVLGYGTGPLLFSPISEIPALGRNIPYIVSFFLFFVVTLAAALVDNYPGLVVCRFLQGFLGGPVLATGGASAGDIFPLVKLPYALSFWAAAAFGGPALGPVISTYAVQSNSYHWALWETLIISGFTFCLMIAFLPETNAETILHWRAQRLRRLSGRTDLKSLAEQKQTELRILPLLAKYMATPFKTMLQDPSIAFADLYVALTYGIYYSWFESFPIVFSLHRGFSVNQTSLTFIAVVLGGSLGGTIYMAVVYFYLEPLTKKYGIEKPEARLIPGLVASTIIPGSCFIFGWAGQYGEISWVVPCIGIVLFSAGAFFILQSVFLYLPLSYPRHAASILTGNGFARAAFATGAIHFSTPMFKNLGVGRGNSILGGLLVGCSGLFFLLYIYGPKLRARSKFAESH